MKFYLKILALVFLIVSSACNKSSDSGGPVPAENRTVKPTVESTYTETRSYEFEDMGCKTGKRQFNSVEDFCKGLQDHVLNNGCAKAQRADYFQQQCTFNGGAPSLNENFETYVCMTLDGNDKGDYFIYMGLKGVSKKQTEVDARKMVKIHKTTKISCAKQGGIRELSGKKWGFQGIRSNEYYLLFQGNQVLQVQECGSEKQITRFGIIGVKDNSFKIVLTGVTGECNPHFIPVFDSGSKLSVILQNYPDQPSTVIVEETKPGEKESSISLYKEMK